LVLSSVISFEKVLAMEDVSVELVVKFNHCANGEKCGQKVMTRTILMWSGMIPIGGDQIDIDVERNSMRFRVIGRVWKNRWPTLFCKPLKSFSAQNLIDLGFAESGP